MRRRLYRGSREGATRQACHRRSCPPRTVPGPCAPWRARKHECPGDFSRDIGKAVLPEGPKPSTHPQETLHPAAPLSVADTTPAFRGNPSRAGICGDCFSIASGCRDKDRRSQRRVNRHIRKSRPRATCRDTLPTAVDAAHTPPSEAAGPRGERPGRMRRGPRRGEGQGASPARFERATPALGERCSIQLSYEDLRRADYRSSPRHPQQRHLAPAHEPPPRCPPPVSSRAIRASDTWARNLVATSP